MPTSTRPNLNLKIPSEVMGSKTRTTQLVKPGAGAQKQKTIQLRNRLNMIAKAKPLLKGPLPSSMDNTLSIDHSVTRTKVEFQGDRQPIMLEPLVVKIPTGNLSDPDNEPICTVHGTHYTIEKDEVIELDLMLSSGSTACFTSVVVVVGIYKDNVPISIKNWIPKLESGEADVSQTWGTHVSVGATLSTSAAVQGTVGRDTQVGVTRFKRPEVEVESIAAFKNQIRWIARPAWKTAVLRRLVCGLVVEVPLPLIAKVHLVYKYQVTSGLLSWRQKEKTFKVPSAENLGDIELELCQSVTPPPPYGLGPLSPSNSALSH